MDRAMVATRNPAAWMAHNLKLVLPGVLLFLALMGFNLWKWHEENTPRLLAGGIPVHREIEEQFGVRITGLYVVGKGGLVDLRYRVVDVGKAKNFGHYTETSPLLIAEDSGRNVEVTLMMLHNHRVDTARVYYVLYRNTADAIRSGTPVTVQIGDLRLRHLVAQ